MAAKRRRAKLPAVAAALVTYCTVASLIDRPHLQIRRAGLPRVRELRFLRDGSSAAVYPWAKRNVLPVSATPDPSNEVAFFWQIPKNAGATTKHIYKCLGRTVDVKSRPIDVLNSEKNGLVSSGNVDVLFSNSPGLAIEHLFDKSNKARVFALFRHPVERLVSKFYYLQIAQWEKSYRPAWKDMDVLHWAESHNGDNNFMVKTLAGGKYQATVEDLERAKVTIKERFIVGLVDEMQESVRRFNTVMGITDETETKHRKCMNQHFRSGIRRNANPHPQVEEGSPAWEVLAEKNALDIQLYEYVQELFGEQKEIIDSYASPTAVSPA